MEGSKKQLRTNPFTTYRDPKTGRWVVVKPKVQEIIQKKQYLIQIQAA